MYYNNISKIKNSGQTNAESSRFLRNKSSQQVKAKNGYLFLKKGRPSSAEKEPRTTVVLKVARPEKFCRYKYFESLPKYAADQPAINLAS